MKIKLYGVRGSIASPSTETVRYGGNTACVFVEGYEGTRLIFDAGTGIRMLGEDIPDDGLPLHIFFSHYHWDHIQGFPFFRPAYQAERKVYLLSDHLSESPKSILEQMADPHFPVPGDELKAKVLIKPITDGHIQLGELSVSTHAANHPGGCCAYRVDSSLGSFAYITDNELFPPNAPVTHYHQWVEWLEGVDILLHDAMYLESERELIHGWGHSLIPEVLQLGMDAAVKKLILFHHDPSRTDAQLDAIYQQSKVWMSENQAEYDLFLAKEGDCYSLD